MKWCDYVNSLAFVSRIRKMGERKSSQKAIAKLDNICLKLYIR